MLRYGITARISRIDNDKGCRSCFKFLSFSHKIISVSYSERQNNDSKDAKSGRNKLKLIVVRAADAPFHFIRPHPACAMIQGRGRSVENIEFVAEIDARDRVTKKKQRLKSGGK